MAVPTYDRWSLAPSVVHFGVGAFHRSHQAVYFDDLAERRISRGWGIVGVGLHRREMREALSAQDGLYTVVSRGSDGSSARVVGAIGHYLFGPDNPEAVVAALAHPRTRLVTLTVTGHAYEVGPKVLADLESPEAPRTVVGYLTEALQRRRRAGCAPFTVLSCDNMPGNGAAARAAVTMYARLRDERLGDWIERNVAFPSSMVDRITPQTTAADRELLERDFGVRDLWPVVTEPFSQWIVEDAFCHGRPPLDRVGAQFVPDVRPYALMKTRMLNASHCAIGYIGSLLGYERIDDAMTDAVLAGYLDALMAEEVAPLLDPVPGIDLDDYRRTLLGRFANRGIADQLSRLCRNGSTKMPAHILSSIRSARAVGRPHARLTVAVAAWIRYLRQEPVIDDPLATRLRREARVPRRMLADRTLFPGLAGDVAFAGEVEACLREMDRAGVREVARAAATEPLAA